MLVGGLFPRIFWNTDMSKLFQERLPLFT